MEDINAEFGQADVAIILGANDVVNPAAHVKGSAIYGMPILEAYKAKTVIVNKRSMAAVMPAWTMNSLDKTMMVFGDAKKVEDRARPLSKPSCACATYMRHARLNYCALVRPVFEYS
jgi:NAD/NADP transhydrogenase beta subunit